MNSNPIRTLFNKLLSQQFLRYLLVGGASWVVDFLVFFLTYSHIGIVPAQTVARIVGALVAFAGHKLIVFEDRQFTPQAMRQQIVQYLILWLVSYTLSVILLLAFIDLLQLHPVAAKLITEAIIIAINFVTMRRYIFASKAGA
ncbi:MAG: GtrA family protein [Candidatus Thiodiazotropha taylori]|nr:GtrA family protein [Candidatus Thiodiazotropha taylori]MCG8055250.1 GtrA family protein [Candidatus Thiodiazotropha taylori]MCG8086826.1 GtrA family protein [Candidatus Thiodiazotropha taylori]MCW4234542.1 GtrA family protein [Candidatus Thiodiazotropha taylori]MCW4317078.1 GtrA family protein [Candidatus Thiodiazotropha taylori]